MPRVIGPERVESKRVPEGRRVRGLFGDQLVGATELARNSAQVLNLALRSPVTITRNQESFALMKREEAQRLSVVADEAEAFMEVLEGVRQSESDNLSEDATYAWLRAFDSDEHAELLAELSAVIRNHLVHGYDPTGHTTETILHEWKESAIAILSEAHEEAFNELNNTKNAVPLTDPKDVKVMQ